MKGIWHERAKALQIGLWTCYLLFLVNLTFPGNGLPGIRLNVSPGIGYAALLLFDALPVLIGATAFLLPTKKVRIAVVVLAGLLALPSALHAHWVLKHGLQRWVKWHNDIFFDKVSEAAGENSVIRVYRVSNDGGTGASFIVRQERELPFGIRVVRDVGPRDLSGEFRVDVKLTEGNTIELDNEYLRASGATEDRWRTRLQVKPSWIFGNLRGG